MPVNISMATLIAFSLIIYIFFLATSNASILLKASLLIPFYTFMAIYLVRKNFISMSFGWRIWSLLVLMIVFFINGLFRHELIEYGYYFIRMTNFLMILFWVMTLSQDFMKKFLMCLSVMSTMSIMVILILDLDMIIDSFCYFVIPFFILSKSRIVVCFFAMLMVYLLWMMEVRGAMLAIPMILLHRISQKYFIFYARNWNKAVMPLIFLLVASEIFIAIFLFDDIAFNLALNKRPYIWNIYLSEFISGDSIQQIFGYGKVTGDFAESVGEIISSQFGVGRKYSAHSLYIGVLYEMGVVGFSIIMLYLNYIFKKDGSKNLRDYQFIIFIFILLGLFSPVSLGGHAAGDFIFTLIFLNLLRTRREDRNVESISYC